MSAAAERLYLRRRITSTVRSLPDDGILVVGADGVHSAVRR